MEGTSPTPQSRLKHERAARLLSLRQFGRLTDIDFTLLSRYENGLVPPESHRDRIAQELGLTPQYLWPAAYGVDVEGAA